MEIIRHMCQSGTDIDLLHFYPELNRGISQDSMSMRLCHQSIHETPTPEVGIGVNNSCVTPCETSGSRFVVERIDVDSANETVPLYVWRVPNNKNYVDICFSMIMVFLLVGALNQYCVK